MKAEPLTDEELARIDQTWDGIALWEDPRDFVWANVDCEGHPTLEWEDGKNGAAARAAPEHVRVLLAEVKRLRALLGSDGCTCTRLMRLGVIGPVAFGRNKACPLHGKDAR